MRTIAGKSDFDAFFEAFMRDAGIVEADRLYFHQHAGRLWQTVNEFGLLAPRHEHLLEIGPGPGYLPFLWKEYVARNVSIFEGETIELTEFKKVYQKHGIEGKYGDLFQIFGERDPAKNVLPFPTGAFDGVVCWETMEHFNFNPVPFVEELKRITLKGGVIYITVPNQAKLDNRLALLMGTSVRTPIDDYFLQLDDKNRMKYAPHWREYTLTEIFGLFQRSGLHIRKAGYLQTFMQRSKNSTGLALKRSLVRLAAKLVPSSSSLCVIEVERV